MMSSVCCPKIYRVSLAPICLALMATSLCAGGSAADHEAVREEAEVETMHALVPELYAVGEARPEDAEIQLGLAILYGRYDRSKDYVERAKAQFETVLELDPDNEVVGAILASETTMEAVAGGKRLTERLEAVIKNAKDRGATQIVIITGPPLNLAHPDQTEADAWNNPLHEILGGKAGNAIIIQEADYEQARAKVREKVDRELNEALDLVAQAESRDPMNALYNYFKANLYFELGQPTLAVKELRTAVGKPSVQTYHEAKQRVVTKALAAANASAALKSYREPMKPIGSYILDCIWRPYLQPLAAKCESGGDTGRAREMYELSMAMAEQIRAEPLPRGSAYNDRVAENIERWARQRLSGSN